MQPHGSWRFVALIDGSAAASQPLFSCVKAQEAASVQRHRGGSRFKGEYETRSAGL